MGGEAGGQERLGEVETIKVGRIERRVVGLTADEVGLTLAEGKQLLGELARLVLQTQMGCRIAAAKHPQGARGEPDNVSTTPTPLSADPSRDQRCLRARAPMIASAYS